jgi:hypothetical protein
MQRFTPRQYLQIDIANNFGLDKKTWSERLGWFEQHQDHLMEMLPQASDPALYYAGVRAWEAVQAGQPIGYPISLDATSSGLQLLAVLTGDRSAAKLCNVVNTGKREDAYTAIYEAMLAKVGESAKIKREDTKTAVMTSLYGSKAEPKRVFGEGKLLTVFEETMAEQAPAAWELNQEFLAIWDDNALSNDWVLPDNFHVHVKVMSNVTETVNFLNEPVDIHRQVNAPTKEGRSLGANTVHSIDGFIVREMTRRCSYDPAKVQELRDLFTNGELLFQNTSTPDGEMVKILWDHYRDCGYLSARILDHLNKDNAGIPDPDLILELIDSLPAKPFQLISIHDCFRCLPSYGNDLREQYNRQLYLIARSDLLSHLLSQLVGRTVKIGKLDPSLARDILDSDYALS